MDCLICKYPDDALIPQWKDDLGLGLLHFDELVKTKPLAEMCYSSSALLIVIYGILL